MIFVWVLSYLAVFMLGVASATGAWRYAFKRVERDLEKELTTNCPEDCICKTVPPSKHVEDIRHWNN